VAERPAPYRLTATPEDAFVLRQLVDVALTMLSSRHTIAASHWRDSARELLNKYPRRDPDPDPYAEAEEDAATFSGIEVGVHRLDGSVRLTQGDGASVRLDYATLRRAVAFVDLANADHEDHPSRVSLEELA
jgi:hypothetical protein